MEETNDNLVLKARQAKSKTLWIDTEEVNRIVEHFIREKTPTTGRHEVLSQDIVEPYQLPLKIVFEVEGDEIIVITAYPLKKARKQ